MLGQTFHIGPPTSVRSYYQEVGRTARHGGQGVALMYLSVELITETLSLIISGEQHGERGEKPSDASIERQLAKFTELMEVLLPAGCRRERLMTRLMGGVPHEHCGACDRCVLMGGCGRAREVEVDSCAAMMLLAEHLARSDAPVAWAKLCDATMPPQLPEPFRSTAVRMQLVLFALVYRIARLVPEPIPAFPQARRGAAVTLEPGAMSVLQRGELEYVLNCIPVSHVSGQVGARDRDAADERESMLERVAVARMAKAKAERAEVAAIRDYLLLPGADLSHL